MPINEARLAELLFDTFTTTAGMLEGIDAESPVNGAVRVVAAPTLFAHVGREIVTAGGPVAGAAVVGAFVTGAALVTAAAPGVVVLVVTEVVVELELEVAGT